MAGSLVDMVERDTIGDQAAGSLVDLVERTSDRVICGLDGRDTTVEDHL